VTRQLTLPFLFFPFLFPLRFLPPAHRSFSVFSLVRQEKKWLSFPSCLKKHFCIFCGGRTQNDGSQTQSFHLSTSKAAFFGSPTEAQPQISQVLHGLHPKLWSQVSAYIPSDFEYLQRLTCIHVPALTDGSLCGFVFWGC